MSSDVDGVYAIASLVTERMRFSRSCCAARLDRRIPPVVPPAGTTSADVQDVPEHSGPVAQETDLAAVPVIPSDRYLPQPQTGAVRLIEELDVESEAVDRAGFDQGPAHAHAKRLEPTLRVPERQPGGETEHQIERATAELAAQGLVPTDQASVECAGAECQVRFAVDHVREQCRQLADRG